MKGDAPRSEVYWAILVLLLIALNAVKLRFGSVRYRVCEKGRSSSLGVEKSLMFALLMIALLWNIVMWLVMCSVSLTLRATSSMLLFVLVKVCRLLRVRVVRLRLRFGAGLLVTTRYGLLTSVYTSSMCCVTLLESRQGQRCLIRLFSLHEVNSLCRWISSCVVLVSCLVCEEL